MGFAAEKFGMEGLAGKEVSWSYMMSIRVRPGFAATPGAISVPVT
jgi:hypothetical protein